MRRFLLYLVFAVIATQLHAQQAIAVAKLPLRSPRPTWLVTSA